MENETQDGRTLPPATGGVQRANTNVNSEQPPPEPELTEDEKRAQALIDVIREGENRAMLNPQQMVLALKRARFL